MGKSHKKNSTVAQVNSDGIRVNQTISAEAAIKMLPNISENSYGSHPIDKDGGPDPQNIERIIIEVAQNGYLLSFVSVDGFEDRTVHLDFEEVLEALKASY